MPAALQQPVVQCVFVTIQIKPIQKNQCQMDSIFVMPPGWKLPVMPCLSCLDALPLFEVVPPRLYGAPRLTAWRLHEELQERNDENLLKSKLHDWRKAV
jgi:hypothetical protein